jgi:hypothetical protein
MLSSYLRRLERRFAMMRSMSAIMVSIVSGSSPMSWSARSAEMRFEVLARFGARVCLLFTALLLGIGCCLRR